MHEWSGAPRAWKFDLEVKSTASVNVNDSRYATYAVVETGTEKLFQAGGGSIDQSKYKTTHWYDPVAGLIFKSERVAIKAIGRDEADGKTTKQSLEPVIYPEGRKRFHRVGRGQIF